MAIGFPKTPNEIFNFDRGFSIIKSLTLYKHRKRKYYISIHCFCILILNVFRLACLLVNSKRRKEISIKSIALCEWNVSHHVYPHPL